MRILSLLYNDFAHWDIRYPEATRIVVTAPMEVLPDDLVIFHGGADISPLLYNHKTAPHTHAINHHRDALEWEMMGRSFAAGARMYCICRGAQMMAAFMGHSLYQDVTGHNRGDHKVITHDGQVFNTNSYHHQMLHLRPSAEDSDYKILAVANAALSKHYVGDGGKYEYPPEAGEPEVVVFPSANALAVQGHPEWLNYSHPLVQFCMNEAENLWKVSQEA